MLGLGDHDLRCGSRGSAGAVVLQGLRGLQGLRLRVQLVEVPAGGAEVAERAHHPSVVPAAAHGYFGEGVALPALLLLSAAASAAAVVVQVAEAAEAAERAALLLLLLLAMALGVGGVVVVVVVLLLVVLGVVLLLLPALACAGMAGGRGKLAHVQLAARTRSAAGGASGAQGQGLVGAEQQGQVISSNSPVVGAVVALLEAWAALLLLAGLWC